MSGLRGMMKEGWHPKGKDGGKESWRGDFKGINQVAGWMGKGTDPNKTERTEHVSKPLAALKDPSLFGPPPKNVNYHGGAALPNQITPQTDGWGAPLTSDQISASREAVMEAEQAEIVEEPKRAGPPLPYRADRTGLRTEHLPPPPVHRDINRGPESVEPAPIRSQSQPRLPPRLPSRQSTGSTPVPAPIAASPPPPTTSPPAYDSIPATNTYSQINQNATSRLAKAGVSVPAFGIGSEQSSNPWRSEPTKSTTASTQPATHGLSELQARFARMNSSGSTNTQQAVTPPFVTPLQTPVPVSTPTPGQSSYMTATQPETSAPVSAQPAGSTWAEKQAAMRTAQSAYKDPSIVSVADAASAARTANTFRERHKDTIDAAGTRATQLNKKYNVTGRLNSFLEKHNSPTSEAPPNGGLNGNASAAQQLGSAPILPATLPQNPEIAALSSRKPPPPPPPKKPAGMHGIGVAPPPVPLGTKPSYS